MHCLTTLFLVLAGFSQMCRSEVVEFEDALNDTQQIYASWRSNASNNRTLQLVDPTAKQRLIHLTLCVVPANPKRNVSMRIENVRYSNDGGSESVVFRIQGNRLGHFDTEELWNQYGNGWNMFKNSGKVGRPMFLRHGQYNLTVESLTSAYGVELDTINIKAKNQHPSLGLVCKKKFVEL